MPSRHLSAPPRRLAAGPGPGVRPAPGRHWPPTPRTTRSPRQAGRPERGRGPRHPAAGTAEDLARPVEVLAGERLDEAKANSLGETVSKLPGVQSSYFGPGVGRPIVRGLDGARVQVLSDGLGSGDVSTVSVDHAVSIEPFLADQIEVLKGPATLLYGSGAIGGAVNVVDGRIPEAVTEQPLQGRAELRGDSVNDEKTGMFAPGRHLGLRQRRLPCRRAASRNRRLRHPRLRRKRAHCAQRKAKRRGPGRSRRHPAQQLRAHRQRRAGRVLGRRARLPRRRRQPVQHPLRRTRPCARTRGRRTGEHEARKNTRGRPRPHRHGPAPLRTARRPRTTWARSKSLRVKVARTDYTHTEFEGDEVGTVFDNDSTEARVELAHQPTGPAGTARSACNGGAARLQRDRRGSLRARHRNRATPACSGSASAAFGAVEAGTRRALRPQRDRRRRRRRDRPGRATSTPPALSAALQWNLSEDFHLSLRPRPRAALADRRGAVLQRPARGDAELRVRHPDLDVETANRAETRRCTGTSGPFKARRCRSITSATTTSSIWPTPASSDDETPARVWIQADARFTGGEAELTGPSPDNDSGAWSLRVFGDIVRGKLTGNGTREVAFAFDARRPHPRIHRRHRARRQPAAHRAVARLGGELRWERDQWRASRRRGALCGTGRRRRVRISHAGLHAGRCPRRLAPRHRRRQRVGTVRRRQQPARRGSAVRTPRSSRTWAVPGAAWLRRARVLLIRADRRLPFRAVRADRFF